MNDRHDNTTLAVYNSHRTLGTPRLVLVSPVLHCSVQQLLFCRISYMAHRTENNYFAWQDYMATADSPLEWVLRVDTEREELREKIKNFEAQGDRISDADAALQTEAQARWEEIDADQAPSQASQILHGSHCNFHVPSTIGLSEQG